MKKDNCPSSCPASHNSNHSNSNHTAQPQPHHNKQYLGYIGAIIAIIFFGSNFIPVKKYETGDGMNMCMLILTSPPGLPFLLLYNQCKRDCKVEQ